MKRLTEFSLFLFLTIASPLQIAHANLVTFNFEGTVDVSTIGSTDPTPLQGETIQGTYMFDSATPGIPNSSVGSPGAIYQNAITSLKVTIGMYQVVGPSSFPLGLGSKIAVIQNDPMFNFGNSYLISSTVTGPPINGYTPFFFNFSLDQLDDSFPKAALPLVPPSLPTSPFDRNFFLSFSSDVLGVGHASGSITSLTLASTIVREPPNWLLLASGMVGLMFWHRQSHRRQL